MFLGCWCRTISEQARWLHRLVLFVDPTDLSFGLILMSAPARRSMHWSSG